MTRPSVSRSPAELAGVDVASDEISARIRWILAPGLGAVTLRRLIDRFGSARAALSSSSSDLPGRARRALRSGAIDGDLAKMSAAAQRIGATATGYRLPGFPEELNHLHDPPPLLFLRGDPSLLHLPAVAVVGSRKASPYGRRIAAQLGEDLAAAGTAVVSGLALGIDGAAHRGALAASGSTIAVLGSGPDIVHPPSHQRLFTEILGRGLVVSEFLPGETPRRHHFPWRNRLIAALAKAVVVVEAARKSGALITVEHALDIGRDVFAVPGDVGRPQSVGAHNLIREGAGLVTSARDVLSRWGSKSLGWKRPLLPRPPGWTPPSERCGRCWRRDRTTLTFSPAVLRSMPGQPRRRFR